jgi:hypothetical protein
MATQDFLPSTLQQVAAPAAGAARGAAGPASVVGGMLPGGSSVMSGLDTIMGMGRGTPTPFDLAGAPPGASGVTDQVMGGGPFDRIKEWTGRTADKARQLGREVVPDWFNPTPEPDGPLKVPVDWNRVPKNIPDPIPKELPPNEPQAPAPRKPMSGPMPEMPWFLEPAGPSTW